MAARTMMAISKMTQIGAKNLLDLAATFGRNLWMSSPMAIGITKPTIDPIILAKGMTIVVSFRIRCPKVKSHRGMVTVMRLGKKRRY